MEVAIPASHRFGQIGTDKPWLFLRDKSRLTIARLTERLQSNFWKALTSEVLSIEPISRHSLFFLHGYNSSFADAAIRAAQLSFDLKVQGVTAMFSWPSASRSGARGYLKDGNSIEASEPAIAEFLENLVSAVGDGLVHIVAHSMGNRALLRTLDHIVNAARRKAGLRLGHIFLAAPDVDHNVFGNLAPSCAKCSNRLTMYVSRYDLALGISKFLNDGHRVGITPPVSILPGVDTVEVPNFNLYDRFGHGYYAEAEALLRDISRVIEHNTPPARRLRLHQAMDSDGRAYWVMRP